MNAVMIQNAPQSRQDSRTARLAAKPAKGTGKEPKTLRTNLVANNGQDLCDEVEMPDADGSRVVVLVNRTARMIDRLFYQRGVLTADQHAWATELRDAWERAGLECKVSVTASWFRGGATRPPVADEEAWIHYRDAMRQLSSDDRRIIIAVIVHDEDPITFGARWRCDGAGMLTRCLDKLGRVWGYR